VKTRAIVICFLLCGCLFAETLVAQTNASSAAAKPQTAPEPAASDGPTKASTKEADIVRLMDLAGTTRLATQMMAAMEQNIRPLMTNSFPPGEYREKLIDLFFAKFHSKINEQQLLNLFVPAYDKYYTHEEIRGLIEFYETPLGQKMAAVQPKMAGELQEAGRKWGEGLGRDSMQEVFAEHPELATALDAAKKEQQPK